MVTLSPTMVAAVVTVLHSPDPNRGKGCGWWLWTGVSALNPYNGYYGGGGRWSRWT